jgi:hypothetical protein
MNNPQRIVSLIALLATVVSTATVARAALEPFGKQAQPHSNYLKLTSDCASIGCAGVGGGECGECNGGPLSNR